MKILSITAQKPHSTGSGTYLTELIKAFDRMGHRQAVVCGIYPSDDVSFPKGVTCYPVFFTENGKDKDLLAASCKSAPAKIKALPFPVVGMSDVMPYTSTLYRDLTPVMIIQFEEMFMDAVGRAVADLDPDLIICHHLFLLTAMVRRNFPERVVWGLSHGSDLRQAENCQDLKELIARDIAGLDKVFALHSRQAEKISELYGIPEESVSISGTGYNSALFNTGGRKAVAEEKDGTDNENPVMLSYAGKMSKAKGMQELLLAIDILNKDPSVPAFEVTLAGGCHEPAIEELLGRLPDNVCWLGQVPQVRLADIFRNSDIFVLPSFYEGLPLVLIEAMACGAVPVSTDLPGVKDWIDSNVSNSNARFIPMPQMKSIDEPTQAGSEMFIQDLAAILKDLITAIKDGRLPGPQPDTSSVTWDGLAAHLLGET